MHAETACILQAMFMAQLCAETPWTLQHLFRIWLCAYSNILSTASHVHTLKSMCMHTETPWVLQDLSTICWSLAKLNVGNRKLLDLIYDRVLIDIPVTSAKDISYQIWGFAALGYPLPTQVLATYWVSTVQPPA